MSSPSLPLSLPLSLSLSLSPSPSLSLSLFLFDLLAYLYTTIFTYSISYMYILTYTHIYMYVYVHVYYCHSLYSHLLQTISLLLVPSLSKHSYYWTLHSYHITAIQPHTHTKTPTLLYMLMHVM